MPDIAITDTTGVVAEYLARVDQLYEDVGRWVREGSPPATTHRTRVEVSEQATGVYAADSLEVFRGPDAVPLRLVPRGRFMLGGLGRVDVRSRLGAEALVFVSQGGPSIGFKFSHGVPSEQVRGRPMFPGVEEGWAWVDESRRTLLHLDRQTFEEHVLGSIG